MNTEDEIFEILADRIERLLAQYGKPYFRGIGDFSLNHDDYGNREVGVIFLKPLFSELILKQLQMLLKESAPQWTIWVSFHPEVE